MLDRGGNKNENDKIKGNNLKIGALKIHIYFTVAMRINNFSLIKIHEFSLRWMAHNLKKI